METMESTMAHAQRFAYPEGAKVYGMVVDGHTSGALVRLGLDALARTDADLLVFLCPTPDDIRDRVDWSEIESRIRFAGGKRSAYDVQMVGSGIELMEASLRMRVMRLPDDYVFI
ncbi:hypothetical protein [Noviherbaspirillum pedocola]|uniref:Uncharacterized protein n=1 Tax=Noviherbaspirillum pedocola TaxID=2801341 RepID=A0A934T473_9BURK|nr:hypothetical protein [Noviherbaspirillum pedocola]MBK4738863.1 hypothetical protein [Noviherbaspirillum pedocola]